MKSNWNWQFPSYCNGDADKWRELSEKCKARDNYTCQKCRQSKSKNPAIVLHAAHIVSKRHGGRDVLSNLRTLCDKCHSMSKGHSHMRAKNKDIKGRRAYS